MTRIITLTLAAVLLATPVLAEPPSFDFNATQAAVNAAAAAHGMTVPSLTSTPGASAANYPKTTGAQGPFASGGVGKGNGHGGGKFK